jgi:hypothetical protein
MQNDLYFRLRASNRSEMESLQTYLHDVGETYRDCQLTSVSMLLKFLEFLGMPERAQHPASAAQQANEGNHD